MKESEAYAGEPVLSDATNKPLRFRCPHCRVVLKGKISDTGKKRKCPKCEREFKIPHPKAKEHEGKPKRDESLIPVICGVCSTRIYATADQVGQSMECPDCFTQTLIKPPPQKPKAAVPRTDRGFGYEMEPAEEIVVTKTLAEELLEEADRVVEKKLEEEPRAPERPFLSGVFFYPFYARVFPVVLGMVLAWAVVLGLIHTAWDMEGAASLLAPFLFAGTGIVLLCVAFPTLVTFQKIFENTSNGDEDTDCRPDGGLLAYLDWIGDTIPLLIAVFVSCAPGMVVMQAFGLEPVFYIGMAFSAFCLFPIVLLSMLESASATGIYSKAVWKSFGQVPGSWFKFYFLTTTLFALCGACIAALLLLADRELGGSTIATGLFALLCLLVLLTIYFRLLGRLAFVMTQNIMVDANEPLDTSDFETNRKNEREVSMGV